MEKWEAVVTAICVYGPLIVWLSLNNIQHGKKLAVMEQASAKTDETLKYIKESVQDINKRLDLFLKNEIDVLKDILMKR